MVGKLGGAYEVGADFGKWYWQQMVMTILEVDDGGLVCVGRC